MAKFIINKAYFHRLLHRKYGKYINDNKPCHQRYLLLLATECNVSLRMMYHFQANTYSCKLMKNVIDVLNITKEEYFQLVELKQED